MRLRRRSASAGARVEVLWRGLRGVRGDDDARELEAVDRPPVPDPAPDPAVDAADGLRGAAGLRPAPVAGPGALAARASFDAAFAGPAVGVPEPAPDLPEVPASERDVVGPEVPRARPDDDRPSPREPPPLRPPPGRGEAPGVDGRRFVGMEPIVPPRAAARAQGPRRAGATWPDPHQAFTTPRVSGCLRWTHGRPVVPRNHRASGYRRRSDPRVRPRSAGEPQITPSSAGTPRRRRSGPRRPGPPRCAGAGCTC